MVVVVFTENLLIKRLFQSTSPTKSGGGLVKVKRLKLGEEEEKTQYWRGWQLASLRLRTGGRNNAFYTNAFLQIRTNAFL